MVDMTGHRALDKPPPSPVKAKGRSEPLDHEGKMLASALLAIICASQAGLGFQFSQWWLFGGVGVVIFVRLVNHFQGQLQRHSMAKHPNGIV